MLIAHLFAMPSARASLETKHGYRCGFMRVKFCDLVLSYVASMAMCGLKDAAFCCLVVACANCSQADTAIDIPRIPSTHTVYANFPPGWWSGPFCGARELLSRSSLCGADCMVRPSLLGEPLRI